MPIAYNDIRALVDDVTFQKRLQVAIWREASKLLRQANPVPPDPVIAWSKAQLKGPSQAILEATIRVATAGNLNDANSVYNRGAAVTDDDLQRLLGVVVADLAGA